MRRQKDAFLRSEGDAWLARNEAALPAYTLASHECLRKLGSWP